MSCSSFAGVDGLQIERRFAARLELQHALPKETVGAIAIDAQTAGAVNEVSAKPLVQQCDQIRIGNLAVVWSKRGPARSRSISMRRNAELLRNPSLRANVSSRLICGPGSSSRFSPR